MLKIFSLFIFLILFSVKVSAKGGDVTGNGGHGVVCEGVFRKSFYTLDLYEKIVFNQCHDSGGGHLDQYLNRALTWSTQKHVYDLRLLSSILEIIKQKIYYTSSHYVFATTDYGLQPELPRNCSLVQLAVYIPQDDLLWINVDYFSKLSPLNQAALIFHEAIYYYNRVYLGKKDSSYARKVVSQAFCQNLYFN